MASETRAEQDLIGLLTVLRNVVQANEGVPADADQRILDAEGLAIKAFIHASACLYLYRGTAVPELKAAFFDPASIQVLARAAIESTLVFHYVFYEPQTEDEREFRHLAWVLADLVERQEFTTHLPENKKKLEREAGMIQTIQSRLAGNHVLQGLTERQRRAVLERKKWRWSSWTEIGESMGLSKMHSAQAYRYLCSYAHSGSLAVQQVRDARNRADQLQLSATGLSLVTVALAFLIKQYAAMFSRAEAALDADARTLVDGWVEIGSHDWLENGEQGQEDGNRAPPDRGSGQ